MSGRQFLALAVIALQQGNQEDCLKYMAKAGEFGDDLTQFVSEVMQPAPTAVRNDGSTPQAENTLAPSLAAASATDFVSLSNRVSRQLAIASFLDEGDELDGDDLADDAFDEDEDLEDDEDVEAVDEDLEDEEEEEEDEEATASADVQATLSGPIRYKC